MPRVPHCAWLIVAALIFGLLPTAPIRAQAAVDEGRLDRAKGCERAQRAPAPYNDVAPTVPKSTPELAAEVKRSTLFPLGPVHESVVTHPDGTKTRETVRHLLMIGGEARPLLKEPEIINFLLNAPKFAALSSEPDTRLSDYLADPELALLAGPGAKLLRLACSSSCGPCDDPGSCFAGQNGSCGVCACGAGCPFMPCVCGGKLEEISDVPRATGPPVRGE